MRGPRVAPAVIHCRPCRRLRDCPLGIRRWICGVHLAVIALLSLLPAWIFPAKLEQIPGMDLWVHAVLYGVLGGLLRWAAGPAQMTWRLYGVPLAGAGYGLLLEFLQEWIGGEGRTFSGADAGANFAGIMAFWILMDKVMTMGKSTYRH